MTWSVLGESGIGLRVWGMLKQKAEGSWNSGGIPEDRFREADRFRRWLQQEKRQVRVLRGESQMWRQAGRESKWE